MTVFPFLPQEVWKYILSLGIIDDLSGPLGSNEQQKYSQNILIKRNVSIKFFSKHNNYLLTFSLKDFNYRTSESKWIKIETLMDQNYMYLFFGF